MYIYICIYTHIHIHIHTYVYIQCIAVRLNTLLIFFMTVDLLLASNILLIFDVLLILSMRNEAASPISLHCMQKPSQYMSSGGLVHYIVCVCVCVFVCVCMCVSGGGWAGQRASGARFVHIVE